MIRDVLIGILMPFFGTALGALPVLFAGKFFSRSIGNALNCFAGGVMVAASVWSLLIPAIENSSAYSVFAFLPATVGLWIGILCLIFTERLVVRLGRTNLSLKSEKHKATFVLVAAVALHNFPEGLAVGVAYAGLLAGDTNITAASAFVLSFGVAVQNIPEGAIVSLPLRAAGLSKAKSFLFGVLSGAVELVGAVFAVVLSFLFLPLMPYFLGIAAGAMISAVVGELIPENSNDTKNTVFFALGFTVMMVLDVALG